MFDSPLSSAPNEYGLLPLWARTEVVGVHLQKWRGLLRLSQEHYELDLHFMVRAGDILLTTIGEPPKLTRENGILAYAPVRVGCDMTDELLQVSARNVIAALSTDYITTVTQIGEAWNAQVLSGSPQDPTD